MSDRSAVVYSRGIGGGAGVPRRALLGLAALGFAVVLAPGWNLFYYWMFNPLYGHGLWVLPLGLFLLWRRREEVFRALAVPLHEPGVPEGLLPDEPGYRRDRFWAGVGATVLVAYFVSVPFFRIVQLANPDWRLIDAIFAIFAVVALLALGQWVGGWKLLRVVAFPAVFLLTSVPWPTAVEHAFTARSVEVTASVASEVLWSCGLPTVDARRTLHTVAGPVAVSDDCSGIRSFQLSLMLALFWGGFFRMSAPRRIGLIGAGFAVAMLLNLARVMFLAVAVIRTGEVGAVQEFHDLAGNVAQLALVLFMPLVAWGFRGARPPEAPDVPAEMHLRLHRVGAWFAAAWIVVAGAEVGSEMWYASREKGRARVALPTPLGAPAIERIAPLPVSPAIRQQYRYTRATSFAWKDAGAGPWSVVALEFERGDNPAFTHNVHRPEVCLPFSDYRLVKTFAPLGLGAEVPGVEFTHQAYRRGGQMLHLFFARFEDPVRLPGEAAAMNAEVVWGPLDRFRAAWQGYRSQRTLVVHLLLEQGRAPQQARAAAAEYLKKLYRFPEPAKQGTP